MTFWRILTEYPEVLAWHWLWNDSYHEIRSQLYGTAKAIAPEKPFDALIDPGESPNLYADVLFLPVRQIRARS